MSKGLDTVDQRLLALLHANARQPLVALAKALGLSRSATQERLRRLETSGVIEGYTTLTRPTGEQVLQAWFKITHRTGYSCEHVVPAVVARPEVKLCHSLAGAVDLLVLAEVGHLNDLAQLREHFATIPGVAGVETAPVLTVHRSMVVGY
jgi:Lrp/AsnC family transcriptional regulator, leucine-responsive regulatory protein